jgi:hypothetical protein
MDTTAVRTLFDQQIRQNARPDGPGTRIERSGGVVRQVGPVHAWNGIVWWDQDLAGAAADAAIAAQAQYFASLGLDCEWKLYSHDRPADLPARLLAAGFAADDPETLMVAPAQGLEQAGRLPEGVTLRPVADAADREGAELMAEVHRQAFDSDGARISERMLSQLEADPDSVVAVIAMAGDRPVSSARLEFVPGTDFAGLWGGGTVPGSPPPGATSTSRWTPPTRAARSCSGWASPPSAPRPPTSVPPDARRDARRGTGRGRGGVDRTVREWSHTWCPAGRRGALGPSRPSPPDQPGRSP